MYTKTIKIHPKDNVEVALAALKKGDQVHAGDVQIELQENIPAKHKFAISDLNKGDEIIMYGVLVGRTTRPVSKGGLISRQNIEHATSGYQLKERKTDWHKPDISKWQGKTFMGFHREDGTVGTRNYWVIIPLVFCENKNVDVLREAFMKSLGYQPRQSPYEAMVNKK